ncbi:g3704 [Coccomyxa viridis]|uniref:G3704 protein n=1 Tax=Coccomyxa viridis TaxID=1274662 RepID=A0ABP1FNF6_9CHLO
MQASSKVDKSCRQSLLDDRNEPTQHHTQRWLTAVSLLLCALLVTIVLLGGSYQQNVLLQQRLSGVKLTSTQEQERALGRIREQLASETLVLREQLMRNKLDSRTVGSALLATQEELKAAFNREQACEEGYNALLADLDSCRVNQERIGANDLSINRAGVQAAKAIEREMQSDALIHA